MSNVSTRRRSTAPGAVAALMDRSNVENVIVGGKVREWQGRLMGADVLLAARIETSAQKLFARAGIERDLFG